MTTVNPETLGLLVWLLVAAWLVIRSKGGGR
jgi:hypothetical protein